MKDFKGKIFYAVDGKGVLHVRVFENRGEAADFLIKNLGLIHINDDGPYEWFEVPAFNLEVKYETSQLAQACINFKEVKKDA